MFANKPSYCGRSYTWRMEHLCSTCTFFELSNTTVTQCLGNIIDLVQSTMAKTKYNKLPEKSYTTDDLIFHGSTTIKVKVKSVFSPTQKAQCILSYKELDNAYDFDIRLLYTT